MSTEKILFSYSDIHETVKEIAKQVQESGYDFDVIVAIGTGGFIPARIFKTYIKKPILTVGLKLYDDDNRPSDTPKKIQWIDEVERKLTGKKILLIDEIDDTRTTLAYCTNELLRHHPKEIAVAVLHRKRKPKNAEFPEAITRHYVGAELEDIWVGYPWDAKDIIKHEADAVLLKKNT